MRFFVTVWKKSYFNAIGSLFARVQSHLKELQFQRLKVNQKKLNCSILLLLTI